MNEKKNFLGVLLYFFLTFCRLISTFKQFCIGLIDQSNGCRSDDDADMLPPEQDDAADDNDDELARYGDIIIVIILQAYI